MHIIQTLFTGIKRSFLDTINLARNNERKITGIVINAFTNQYILDMNMLEVKDI